MPRLLEIRTYRLNPGEMDAFHHAMQTKVVPLLKSKGMDVVAHGRSDHEEETYFLARAYASREALEKEQTEFYGSGWRPPFEVSKLGRINLIVGKNNAGKSSVLEALRICAGHANKALLDGIALEHDETLQDLFTGRHLPADDTVDHAIQIVDG
jgi:hypothetical protein